MLHTTHGIAVQLQLPAREVDRMADAGQIPVVVLPNGVRRFDGEQVRRWLTMLRREPVMMVSGERA